MPGSFQRQKDEEFVTCPPGHQFCGVTMSSNFSERFEPLQWSTRTRSYPIPQAKFHQPSSMSD